MVAGLLLALVVVEGAVSLLLDDGWLLLDVVMVSEPACEVASCCRPAAARRVGMAVFERSRWVNSFFRTSLEDSVAGPRVEEEDEEK